MELKVKVIDPDKIVFEGVAEHVMAPGVKSMLGIFPTHTPLFAELKRGEILIKGEKDTTIALVSGIIRVVNDEVTILISEREIAQGVDKPAHPAV